MLYLTMDEVNFAAARRWADQLFLPLQQGFSRDPVPHDWATGLLIDLDVWGAGERHRLVTGLTRRPPSCPVAVHSYNLDARQTAALGSRGVLVFRRLEPKVLLLLTQGRAGMGGTAA